MTASGVPGVANRIEVMEPPIVDPQKLETRRMIAVIPFIPWVKGSRSTTPMAELMPGNAPNKIPEKLPKIAKSRFIGERANKNPLRICPMTTP